MEDKSTTLIAWRKVCQPNAQGGLGVLDISLQNSCLQMKFPHKLFNHVKLPWIDLIWKSYYPDGIVTNTPTGSFWWKSILKLLHN